MVHVLTSLVGTNCELKVKNGMVYDGVFKTYSPECDLVLDAANIKSPGPSVGLRQEDLVDSIIFKASDVVVVHFRDVDFNFARKDNFTDTAVGGRINGEHKEKDLEPWDGGRQQHMVSGSLESLDTDSNGWDPNDMFKYNEEQYGIKSTYDSSLSTYTVALERDNSEEFLKREARAAQLAEEIESSSTYKSRVALENDERSEEEKYTAVVRGEREQHTLNRENKYIPPGQRNREGMSWGAGRQNSPRLVQSSSGPARPGLHDYTPSSGADQRVVNGGATSCPSPSSRYQSGPSPLPPRAATPTRPPSRPPSRPSRPPSHPSAHGSPAPISTIPSRRMSSEGPPRMSPKTQRTPRTHRVPPGSRVPPGVDFMPHNAPGEVPVPPATRSSSSSGTWSSVVSGGKKPHLSFRTGVEMTPGKIAWIVTDIATVWLYYIDKWYSNEKVDSESQCPRVQTQGLHSSGQFDSPHRLHLLFLLFDISCLSPIFLLKMKRLCNMFLCVQPKPATTPTPPRPQGQPSPSIVMQQPQQVYFPQMYPLTPVSPGVQVRRHTQTHPPALPNMPQQRSDQHHPQGTPTMMHPAAGPPIVAQSPAYSTQYFTCSPQQFASQQLMPHYQSQAQHVFSPVMQGQARMMAPPTHGHPGQLVSSTTQYGEQTHTMYVSQGPMPQQYAHPNTTLHPQPSATPTGQSQQGVQHGGNHPAPSPVQQHQAAAAAQALHMGNQPQQQMYQALAPTPPSMTPGPNPQSPQGSFSSAQQAVYLHPQQMQHGYNPSHMAHMQQAHLQSGMVPSHHGNPGHPQMMLMAPQQPGGPQNALNPIPVSSTAHFSYLAHPQVQQHHQQQL
uniref:Ataxin 2 n=1 Tax=Salmo trutta TaxID=8032 RepID=A0A674B5P4_SALTR